MMREALGNLGIYGDTLEVVSLYGSVSVLNLDILDGAAATEVIADAEAHVKVRWRYTCWPRVR